MLEEFNRVARFRLHLEQALQPLVGFLLQFRQRSVRAFVEPVRGDAGLGDLVHVGGADLDLDRAAEGAEQRGVQRLIAVGFRDRNVILELARDRLVEPVQQAEGDVAGGGILDDDAEAEDVVHLREGQVLLTHLAIDRVQVLLASLDLGLDAVLAQPAFDAVEHFADHFAAVAAGGAHRLGQNAVAVGVEVAERQILHLLVDAVKPQAVGDRRVDIQRLAGDALAFLRVDGVQRAHVVQTIGELDQHHAHVARHRQQHLAKVLCLRLFLGIELDAVELGDAIDEFGYRATEQFGDLVLGDVGVFDDVVQQGCRQRLRVHVPLREDAGDRQRVVDVGLSGLAELALVRRLAELIGRAQLADVLGSEVFRPVLEEGRCRWRYCRRSCARGWCGHASGASCRPRSGVRPSLGHNSLTSGFC